ncbi:polyprenyl synthetase family protein [Streptomyces sp. NPDC005301]|uniref:polyprenyl synthetase family protein n=1 Tax=Streptomyces sp. NPDC005301 TaxID=3156874 RepID=UPI00339EC333
MTALTTPYADERTAPADVSRLLRRCRELVAPALGEAVGTLHPWVGEMAGYALGRVEAGGTPTVRSPGKGVRQALAVLGAEAVGAPAEAGVPAAVCVELVHTFSLLHDDIMDGDPLRRGRPAVWKAYGTGPAVLAGDALFALAVETLAAGPSRADAVPPRRVEAGPAESLSRNAGPTPVHMPAAVRRLTAALRDLVHGQADDLQFARRPWSGPEAVSVGEYETMAERKTGALLGCALALGAQLAGAGGETVTALDRAGRHLGVAFQITDDLLGIWGDPAVTGKPVHGDLRQGKKTLPVLAALDTPGRAELTGLLARAARDDSAVRQAALLVERCGGRAAALSATRRHLADAEALLAAAALAPRPLSELRSLLAGLTHRTV